MTPALRLAVLATVLVLGVVLAVRAGTRDATPIRTLLVTGFGPFGGYETNPSWEAIRHLDGTRVGGYVIRTAELDVVYAAAPGQLDAAIRETGAYGVLCFGVAPGPHIRLEVVARNRDRTAQPDVDGEIRSDVAIRGDGASLLPTRLPVAALREALKAGAWPVVTSEDAGGYLCNHVFYRLMDRGDVPGPRGFVHVPGLEGDWDLGRLKAAVRVVIETVAAE